MAHGREKTTMGANFKRRKMAEGAKDGEVEEQLSKKQQTVTKRRDEGSSSLLNKMEVNGLFLTIIESHCIEVT